MSGCSCHICPPCSYCMESVECPDCGRINHQSLECPCKWVSSLSNEIVRIENDLVYKALIGTPKCECGAHSVGVDKHSDWCPLWPS